MSAAVETTDAAKIPPAPANATGAERHAPDTRPLSLAGACALALVAGAAVMMLEVLAFRMVSRFFGTSHFTVSAIIGSVLGGLAIGNYVGGLLADRESARPLLTRMFVLASAACFLTPVVNALVGDWAALWQLTWPQRTAVHALVTFVLPSACLGAIAPVAAKAALETGHGRGRILGDVYAWNSLGCIAGTFAAGFFMIEALGLYVAGYVSSLILGVVAVTLSRRYWLARGWLAAAGLVLLLAVGPWKQVRERTADLGLRDHEDPDTLFLRDSAYSQVRVARDHEKPGQLVMLLDRLKHSQFDPSRPDVLLYGYERVYAAVTAHTLRSRGGGDELQALILGGGGYTHPRDILRRYPKAQIEVVEIDPMVTEAARAAFGLADDPRMKIVHLDARQHVKDLVASGTADRFDYVFLDAVSDFNVPYHLATKEFQANVKKLLRPDGVYLMSLIDMLEEGKLLAATVRTARENFAHVNVFIGEAADRHARTTFVVVTSDRHLNLGDMDDGVAYGGEVQSQLLKAGELDEVLNRTEPLVLMDDYSPVEQLLAGVVRRRGVDLKIQYYHRADVALRRGRFEAAIDDLEKAVELDPGFYFAWLNLGICCVEAGRHGEAEAAFMKAAALEPDEPAPLRNLGRLYFDAGTAEVSAGQRPAALAMFHSAIAAYSRAAELAPSHGRTLEMLGKSLGNAGRHAEAAEAFEKALAESPGNGELGKYLEIAREMARRQAAATQAASQPATEPASQPANDVDADAGQ